MEPGLEGSEPPTFVYAIIVSLFVLFNIFAVNMWLQYKQIGPWRDYLVGEKVYILLSLTAKALLAWQVFAAVLAGSGSSPPGSAVGGLCDNRKARGPLAGGRLRIGPVRDAARAAVRRRTMKGSQKPKNTGKKPAQKSIKERRAEKRAAAKQTRSLDV